MTGDAEKNGNRWRADRSGQALDPLPGEAGIPNVAEPSRTPISRKGLVAVALLILSMVAVSAVSIQRFAAGGRKSDDGEAKSMGNRPTAAGTGPHKLDMTLDMKPVPSDAASAANALPRVPAIVATAEDEAEPIGVHRTGQSQTAGGNTSMSPLDAPVLLVSARPSTVNAYATTRSADGSDGESTGDAEANGSGTKPGDPLAQTQHDLEGYQRHLQGVLDTLTRSAAAATSGAAPATAGPAAGPGANPGSSLFGGQLQGSATPRVMAAMLGNRSLVLPKGTVFTCALKTKIVSATSGFIGCQVQRNVYGDDGRVLLIERGSHIDGEYRVASVRPGTVRIPVLWTRIRTPLGVTVDIDSPATGALGESGIDGYIDNRWGERIGAAMLLSLIDDSVQLVIQDQANRNTNNTQGNTIVLPSTTQNTSKLAEKVLDSTINIPPLIFRNQGGIVGIYVARDVDFSGVYALKATTPDKPQ